MRLSDNSQAALVVFNEHYRQLLSCENVIIIIFFIFGDVGELHVNGAPRRLQSESPTPLLVTGGSVLQGAPELLVSLSTWAREASGEIVKRAPCPFGPQFSLCIVFFPLRAHPNEMGGRSVELVQLPGPHRSPQAVSAASVHLPATFPARLI